ncbi:hypothetical protein EW146_g7394 [Bondarzewia mesenterica]|uniref:UBX domain-containing protein n=1 Tax=Bondarzewia mesenterica TaxID=1095465 RepID=A0A4S4LLF6_9AGAM|nr:hypothetical protein EW146_g7394 [Bondarzewia mesenterica]
MSDNKPDLPRTLSGERAADPIPSSWARPTSSGPRIGRIGGWNNGSGSSSPSNSSPRVATLHDMGSGSGGGGGDDDDEDDERKDQAESWFAGGERSGISIENPDRRRNVPGGNVVRDLLRRAAEAGPPPEPEAVSSTSRFFSGGGHTLGSDEVESSFVPDPSAPTQAVEEPTIRHLTFWLDGFSVEDGELRRYDDPANAQLLNEINAGRAPPSILNVQPGEAVELRVAKRLTEEYVPPPKSAFSGSGNRLGAPVPEPSASSGSSAMPGEFPGASGSAPAGSIAPAVPSARREPDSINTRFEVDQTKPTTSLQIRLADGTRLVCRMNLTHTVRDIRNFINAARPENLTRPYTVGTTFPNRVLEDDSATIETAGLVNSVIVQRWA